MSYLIKVYFFGLLGALTVLIAVAIIISKYSDYIEGGISSVIIHSIKLEQTKIERSLLSEKKVEDKALSNSQKLIRYLKNDNMDIIILTGCGDYLNKKKHTCLMMFLTIRM